MNLFYVCMCVCMYVCVCRERSDSDLHWEINRYIDARIAMRAVWL